MRIEELQLYTNDLDAQHAFYADLLGLKRLESGERLSQFNPL